MYKETLRGIAGIGLFPVVSLLLFVIVFVLAVIRAIRMDSTDAARLAPLPLDAGDVAAAAGRGAPMSAKEHDPAAGPKNGQRPAAKTADPQRDELLDHDADGIREFDNDLPRWWLYGFYFTIAFAVVYMVNYHVLPAPAFGKAGMAAEYQAELHAANTRARASGPAAAANPSLVALSDESSLAKGRAIFESPDNVCSSCHRPDLGGLVGPNLTDDYWLHGCSVQDVAASIKTGYPLKGMMPFGTGKPLTDEQVLQVASYVLARRGSSPAGPKPNEPERDVICR